MKKEYNNFHMRLLQEAADRLAKAEQGGAKRGVMLFAPDGYGIWFDNHELAHKAIEEITVKGCSYTVWRDGTGYACVGYSVTITE